MKVIGLMLTWNNLEFFKRAFMQALEFCDELILVEGCHSLRYPQRSDDGTMVFIRTIRMCSGLRMMDFMRTERYDYIQRRIREQFPKTSRHYQPGNWVFHWDDDLFFMERDLQRLKDMMRNCKEDSLDLICRNFSYNFKINILKRMSPVCYRITEGLRLRGVSNAHYGDGRHYSVSYPDGITAFHYTYVKRAERMKARFMLSAEKRTPGAMDRFDMWKNIRWTKNIDILDNDKLKKVMAKGELNIYEGSHPEVLDNHPWRYIDDVREVK